MGLEDHFDKIADAELRYLEDKLGQLDPDELEVELSQGGKVEWRTSKDELRATLGKILSDKIGRQIQV